MKYEGGNESRSETGVEARSNCYEVRCPAVAWKTAASFERLERALKSSGMNFELVGTAAKFETISSSLPMQD